MKRFDLIEGIRIAGAALTASLALVLASVSFLAPFLGVPELDPARKVALSMLCVISPLAFAWAQAAKERRIRRGGKVATREASMTLKDIRKAA